MADNERFRQILAAYPPAITDFYGSGTVCLYKTGPAWPVAEGQVNLVRAARPLYNVEKSPMWLQTAWAIVGYLDSLDAPMLLTTVDPLAYANVGEAALICDFVVVISVKPNSLAQGDAVAAAPGVIAILENAKFSEVQVAFVEGDYHRQAKFMPFDPNSELESTAILRKPFSLTLSLSIASHRTPHYEGTGGVFIRLSSDESDKRVFVLTCAHIACPPPNFENRSYTRKNPSQARENFTIAITSWQTSLNRIPEYAEDEPTSRTDRRNQLTTLIAVAKKSILTANELHNAVTKTYA
ncbi:hypothetical protein MPER_10335 [Moniliophthora perniciosa FA553]|nr:hypothetical protein MPER_10335 [Moniliophthora perniciosa FA553]